MKEKKHSSGALESLIKVAAIYVFATTFHTNIEGLIESTINDRLPLSVGIILVSLTFFSSTILAWLIWHYAPKLSGYASNKSENSFQFEAIGEDQILCIGIKLFFIIIMFSSAVKLASMMYLFLIKDAYNEYMNSIDNMRSLGYDIAINLTQFLFAIFLVFKTKNIVAYIMKIEMKEDDKA